MIFAIAEGLKEKLLERGYPVTVEVGPIRVEELGASRHRGRIVVERDTSADMVSEPVGADNNPRRLYARWVAHKVTIYASETASGAMQFEHHIELDKYVDGVLCGLRDWCKEQRTFDPEFTSARVLPLDEMGGAEVYVCAGYEILFRVARSVDRRDYDGTAEDTADISAINTTSRVSLDGDTFEEI